MKMLYSRWCTVQFWMLSGLTAYESRQPRQTDLISDDRPPFPTKVKSGCRGKFQSPVDDRTCTRLEKAGIKAGRTMQIGQIC